MEHMNTLRQFYDTISCDKVFSLSCFGTYFIPDAFIEAADELNKIEMNYSEECLFNSSVFIRSEKYFEIIKSIPSVFNISEYYVTPVAMELDLSTRSKFMYNVKYKTLFWENSQILNKSIVNEDMRIVMLSNPSHIEYRSEFSDMIIYKNPSAVLTADIISTSKSHGIYYPYHFNGYLHSGYSVDDGRYLWLVKQIISGVRPSKKEIILSKEAYNNINTVNHNYRKNSLQRVLNLFPEYELIITDNSLDYEVKNMEEGEMSYIPFINGDDSESDDSDDLDLYEFLDMRYKFIDDYSF
jgi:hypothetical protein